ncbi:MAG: prepilin peptidase [Pseudomonadota bacterium]
MIETVENWRWLLYALLVAAAFSDIRSLKIPNALPVLIAASSALALFAGKAAAVDYQTAALSGLIGLGVGYAFYAFGLMGAGDGKLFAAAATWFTAGALLPVSLLVSLAGVALALGLLLVRTLRGWSAEGRSDQSLKSALKTPVPYGVAIALGFVAAAQQMAAG